MGRMKNSALREVALDYLGRIERLNPVAVEEIPDEALSVKGIVSEVLEREAQKVERRLKPGSCLIVLDERGEQWTSRRWAEHLGVLLASSSHREIVFLLGGAQGISERLKRRADLLLGLSKLTLPHQLARVFLLEQVYRALTILRNFPYHNDG